MDEPTAAPPPPPPDTPDSSSPAETPNEAPTPETPKPDMTNDNRGIMIVLSYLWLLALVPFLVESEDQDIRWHAKHGLVLLGAEIILMVVLSVFLQIPFLGCFIILPLFLVVSFGILILHVVCIVKGIQGNRFLIPKISEFADKF